MNIFCLVNTGYVAFFLVFVILVFKINLVFDVRHIMRGEVQDLLFFDCVESDLQGYNISWYTYDQFAVFGFDIEAADVLVR